MFLYGCKLEGGDNALGFCERCFAGSFLFAGTHGVAAAELRLFQPAISTIPELFILVVKKKKRVIAFHGAIFDNALGSRSPGPGGSGRKCGGVSTRGGSRSADPTTLRRRGIHPHSRSRPGFVETGRFLFAVPTTKFPRGFYTFTAGSSEP
jgi:hypothetical protein